MIHFFRKMRQNWLSEGNSTRPALPSGRYLKYAIGEIALVVIGILIALSINNWNEDRKERELEKELLVELLTTVKTNQGLLSRGLERWQSTTEAIDLIMHVLDHQLPYADSLAVYFAEAHRKRGNNLNSFMCENTGHDIINWGSVRSETEAHLKAIEYLKKGFGRE